ncbi:uncharacterized protein PAF06_007388 [Gastrophryne carolinensis]
MFSLDPVTILVSVVVILFLANVYSSQKKQHAKNFPPGPKPLPIIGNLHLINMKKPHKTFIELSKTYGTVFTVQMAMEKVVVLCGYDTIKDALINHDEELSDRPSLFLLAKLLKGNGIAFSSGENWKVMRRFSLSTLRDYGMGKKSIEDKICDEAVHLIEEFRSYGGRPFNNYTIINAAVANIIVFILLSQRFDYYDAKIQELMRLINENIRLLGLPTARLYNSFPTLMTLIPGAYKKIAENVSQVHSFIQETFTKQRKELDVNDQRNFIDTFLTKQQEGKPESIKYFHDENLSALVSNLFGAGMETTSTTLRWGLMLMMKYPETQKKVQDEIERVIGTAQPRLEHRKQMPYTDAVIHEIQRFGDILPGNIAHAASQDMTFRGYFIPKGTTVIPLLSSALKDEAYFQKPYEFYPEHFLDAHGNFKKNEAFIPFSIGKRSCAGETLAKMELFLFFTALLQAFRFQPVPGAVLDLTPVVAFTNSPSPHEICAKQVNVALGAVMLHNNQKMGGANCSNFMGVLVSPGKREPLIQRMQAITSLTVPATHTALRQFSVLFYFSKEFIENVAFKASPPCIRNLVGVHFARKATEHIIEFNTIPQTPPSVLKVLLENKLNEERPETLMNLCSLMVEDFTLMENIVLDIPSGFYNMISIEPVTVLVSIVVILFLANVYKNQKHQKYKNMPPGPKPLPIIGNMLKINLKKPHESFTELSKTYGTVFTVQMAMENMVVLCGYDTIKDALINHDEELSDRPTTNVLAKIVKGNGIIFANGENWKVMRRFSLSTLRDYGMGKKSIEDKISDEAVCLIEAFRSYKGRPFNNHTIINAAVANIIVYILLSRRFEYEDPKIQKLMRLINENIRLMGSPIVRLYNIFPFLMEMIPGGFKKIAENISQVQSFMRETFTKHRNELDINDQRNLIDTFLAKQQEGKPESVKYFHDDNLTALVTNLFAAGMETTSTTLRWGILLMMKYPEIQKKVQDEIDQVIGTAQPRLEHRKQMPYTDAVIHEIQRFGDIAPGNVPHAASQDLTFRGYFIPKGTIVIPLLCSALKDEAYFQKPYEFYPEHFLDAHGNFKKNEAFIPFSIGKRSCAGENLAKMELFLFFTALLQAFRFQVPPGTVVDLTPAIGFTNSPLPHEICVEDRT